MLDFSSLQTKTSTIKNWLNLKKPDSETPWPIIDSETKQYIEPFKYNQLTHGYNWKWPNKKIHFISDIHADSDALISSLILSGTIKKTGLNTENFILTANGKKDLLIIGGDCLDKGPSNLSLLRTLKKLLQLKKNTILLAGNHDIRLFMGLKSSHHIEHKHIASEHFFVRMGAKVIPLLKEVYDEYIRNSPDILNPPSEHQCRTLLFPSRQWQARFKDECKYLLNPKAQEKELKNIRKKSRHFESNCLAHGLSLPMVYLAAQKCYSLFMKPGGEFYWFFNKMKLIHREKSFLFTHAGLDNKITKTIKNEGIKITNTLYKKMLNQNLCQFYYGTLANMMRTKYRNSDPILTEKGVKRMHDLGIHAVIHGHIHKNKGQNISLRSGMLHFECDITLDKNSRIKAGLSNYGAGVTIISPNGTIKGISTDSPQTKVFNPSKHYKKH